MASLYLISLHKFQFSFYLLWPCRVNVKPCLHGHASFACVDVHNIACELDTRSNRECLNGVRSRHGVRSVALMKCVMIEKVSFSMQQTRNSKSK